MTDIKKRLTVSGVKCDMPRAMPHAIRSKVINEA